MLVTFTPRVYHEAGEIIYIMPACSNFEQGLSVMNRRTLSGIAAKNATLAWLGGGALAAGGKGIAGGLAVLGGIQLAPVFAVSGFVFASKARQNLENAKSNLSQAENLAATMRTAIDTLREINTLSATQRRLISKLDAHLLATLEELEPALASAYNKAADRNARSLLFKIRRLLFGAKTQVKIADLNEYHRILFLESLSCVGLLNRLLMVPLLSESGEITRECKAIAEQAERFVETRVD